MADSVDNNRAEDVVDTATTRRLIADKVFTAISDGHTDGHWFDVVGGSLRDGILKSDRGEWAQTDRDIDLTFKLCEEREEEWKELDRSHVRAHCAMIGAASSRDETVRDAAKQKFEKVDVVYCAMAKADKETFGGESCTFRENLERAGLCVVMGKDRTQSYGIWMQRILVSLNSVTVNIDLSFRPTYHLDFDVNSLSWNKKAGLFIRDKPRANFEDDYAEISANIRDKKFNVMWFKGWGTNECHFIFSRIQKMEERGWRCLNAEQYKEYNFPGLFSGTTLLKRLRLLQQWRRGREDL